MIIKVKDLDAYIETLNGLKNQTLILMRAGRGVEEESAKSVEASKPKSTSFHLWGKTKEKQDTIPLSDLKKTEEILNNYIEIFQNIRKGAKADGTIETNSFIGAEGMVQLLFQDSNPIGHEINRYLSAPMVINGDPSHDGLNIAVALYKSALAEKNDAFAKATGNTVQTEVVNDTKPRTSSISLNFRNKDGSK